MNKAHLSLGTTRTKTTHGRNRWTLACLALLGALCLVVVAVSYWSSYAAEPASAKLMEFQSLQKRLETLNPQSPEWNKVKQALDDWAKKYGVESRKVERARPASGGGLTPCPKTVSGPDGYYCYYESSDRGKCYYRCVKL